MKGKISVFVAFCLILPAACSESSVIDSFPEDAPVVKADISYSLDNSTYSTGEDIRTEITVSSLEDFPLPDCYLVIQIARGEHSTPDIDETVFYEETTPSFTLAPESSKVISFHYTLPSDLKAGTYRLEAYLVAARSYAVGVPHLFMNPLARAFIVESAGEFPGAYILRNETVFMDVPFQDGPLVNAGSVVNGTVYIQNNKNNKAFYSLNVKVCEWDDTSCKGGPAAEKTYSMTADPLSVAKIPVSFYAPAKPQAYSIRLELREENGRMVSLYRSRIVVSGEAARIRKAASDRIYYNAGDSGKVMLLIGPSPDQVTHPVIKNAEVSVSVRSKSGEEIYSKSSVLSELSVERGFVPVLFNYTVPAALRDYTVCSRVVSSGGSLFDEYCFYVDSGGVNPEMLVNLSVAYDFPRSLFEIGLCVIDPAGLRSEANVSTVLMRSSDSNVIDYADGISLSPCRVIELKAPQGEYSLVINEKGTNRQFTYQIEAKVSSTTFTAASTTTVPVFAEPSGECGDGICSETEGLEVCCKDCGCADGRICVGNLCEGVKPLRGNNPSYYYAVAGVVGILLLLGLVLYLRRLQAGKGG